MSTIPKDNLDKIDVEAEALCQCGMTIIQCSNKRHFKQGAEFGYQLATDGREEFWTEEMILRFAELYRWSSGRITVKGFKESKDWQTADIKVAKENAKQIDDGREELEKENGYQATQLIIKEAIVEALKKEKEALQSSLKEKEEEIKLLEEREVLWSNKKAQLEDENKTLQDAFDNNLKEFMLLGTHAKDLEAENKKLKDWVNATNPWRESGESNSM